MIDPALKSYITLDKSYIIHIKMIEQIVLRGTFIFLKNFIKCCFPED